MTITWSQGIDSILLVLAAQRHFGAVLVCGAAFHNSAVTRHSPDAG
jgi:hypothetical protein